MTTIALDPLLDLREAPAAGGSPWAYDTRAHRYRDLRSGRFLSATAMVELRDDFLERRRADIALVTDRLLAGDLPTAAWYAAMRWEIAQTTIVQYAFGRGGRSQLTDQDRRTIAELIGEQEARLFRFALEVEAGELSARQIAARAQLYVDSATRAYERGQAAAFRVVLPAYPGDGSTLCRARCKCHWALEDDELVVRATWTLGSAEHCETCLDRAARWAPLVLFKTGGGG
ncbi:MAG: hypothetical protein KatS3mg060_1175 [Dehalococcoidia bacterium]|nr:MAG: hypothetical protein KatS3mg060_1175 [Dehalococcoidia bacterium]